MERSFIEFQLIRGVGRDLIERSSVTHFAVRTLNVVCWEQISLQPAPPAKLNFTSNKRIRQGIGAKSVTRSKPVFPTTTPADDTRE